MKEAEAKARDLSVMFIETSARDEDINIKVTYNSTFYLLNQSWFFER